MAIEGVVVTVADRTIRGWAVDTDSTEPVEVTLHLDGQPINRTWAMQYNKRRTQRNGGHVSFSFGMMQLWQHLRRRQRLTVTAAGQPLRFRHHGESYVVQEDGPDPVDVAAAVRDGMVISKFGRLMPPAATDTTWAEQVIPEYQRLHNLFACEFDRPLFIFHGALLGIAREGGLIAHDQDIDLAYLSPHSDPDEVRDEFFTIQRRAISLRPYAAPHEFKLRILDHRMSITACWFDKTGQLFNSYGFVGDGDIAPDDVIPLRTVTLQGHDVHVPSDPEAVSRYTYGRYWRYPDPGWRWLAVYKSRPETLASRLSPEQVEQLEAMRMPT